MNYRLLIASLVLLFFSIFLFNRSIVLEPKGGGRDLSQAKEPKSDPFQWLDSQDTGKEGKSIDQESRSLESLVSLFSIYSQKKRPLQRLIAELKQIQLDPEVVRDSNPHTGDLHIVRTHNFLPGTRYLHAQFFSEPNKAPFMQHLSFEFRPGDGALSRVLKVIRKKFPQLKVPIEKNSNFTQWELENGFILWVKRLDSEDVVGDSFNAYLPEDKGTIRVVMEMNVHEHGDHHAKVD